MNTLCNTSGDSQRKNYSSTAKKVDRMWRLWYFENITEGVRTKSTGSMIARNATRQQKQETQSQQSKKIEWTFIATTV